MAKHRGIENFYEEFDEDEKYDFEQDYEDFHNQIAINMKDIRMKYPAERGFRGLKRILRVGQRF